MKRFKIFVLAVVILPLALSPLMAAVDYALDPDHIFSTGSDYPFIARGMAYYKNAGVINNYDIKNIAVGGSLMSNIIPSEAEAVLGWQDMYTLTLNAADAASLAALAQHALRKHKIQNMLFSLQPERLADIPASRKGKRGGAKNFIYLYDESRFNDLMVLAQTPAYYVKTFLDDRQQRKDLAKKFPGLTSKEVLAASKDLYAHYMARYRDFNRPLFISSLETADRAPPLLAESQRENLLENFNQHIRPVVEGNPGTQFHFIVEPTTFLGRRANRNRFSYALKILVERLSAYPNVTLHAFANDAFNADLRLFKDLDHSHIEVSRFILQSLARGDHRLTADNVDAYLRRFNRLMDDYKVPAEWHAGHYRPADSPYPKEGYVTHRDAAKLVWRNRFNDSLYNSIPRSPYLAEGSYVETDIKTWPPLGAPREALEKANLRHGRGASTATPLNSMGEKMIFALSALLMGFILCHDFILRDKITKQLEAGF